LLFYEDPFTRARVSLMGERIEFADARGRSVGGYLAVPASGSGPGVVVIQEWWGLIDQIARTCDRLAQAGFVALAPDLYDGRSVPLGEPDEAAKAMMALRLDDAAADMAGAVESLKGRTGRDQVGVIGFCMGGGLALVLAAQRSDVAAVVPCYGVHPWPEAHPVYQDMVAATQIHCAGKDDFFTPAAAEELVGELSALGKEVELHLYPECSHAFFNEDRPEVYDQAAAELLFERATNFLHQQLG
jgi:carboxymethylenebutenolidase